MRRVPWRSKIEHSGSCAWHDSVPHSFSVDSAISTWRFGLHGTSIFIVVASSWPGGC
uniref:Uncharacterized protein n=1 Tax=Arundo donax TaxID=35708 RepID=A0A0A8ZTR5_ARUDO